MDQSQGATSVIESLLTGMIRLCLCRPWRAVGAGAEPTFRPPFWDLGGGARDPCSVHPPALTLEQVRYWVSGKCDMAVSDCYPT